MIDLSSIVQSAQGGTAVDAIAKRFGLSPEQAQSAIDAVLPAIRMGLQNASANGNAGAVLSQMADPAHQRSFEAPPGAAPEPASAGSILGSLFGGHAASAGVAQQAAAQSGVSASVIQAMMPMIVSMVLGGLAKGAQTGAFGGALSSILGSVLGGGGLGSIFGQGTPPAGQGRTGPTPEEGGLGGLIGSVLGGLLGGGAGPAAAPRSPAGEEEAAPPAGTGVGATPESTLDELSSMVQAGTPSSPDHENRLASILGR